MLVAMSPILLVQGWTSSSIAADAACPRPTTCELFELHAFRWPADTSSTVTIPYHVNPTQPWVGEQEAIDAVRAAAETWNDANPRIRLTYAGRTDSMGDTCLVPLASGPPPCLTTSSLNVIAWRAMRPEHPSSFQLWIHPGTTRIARAAMNLNMAFPWSAQTCGGADGSCTGTMAVVEIQNLVTQGFGYWLGLSILTSDDAAELTMFGVQQSLGERKKATLGLGDLKGVRAAYPCDPCPSAPIFEP